MCLLNQVEDILATSLASLVPLTPVELYNSVNALANVEVPLQWGEFLMRFSSLSGFLVRRADDTLMFFHPTFREWLVRRKDFESKKFLCDPRNGHAAIAFRYMTERLTFTLACKSKLNSSPPCRMCRGQEGPLTPDKTLELGHHILKAHLFRSMENSATGVGLVEMEPRDLQALWVSMSTEDASLALGAVRNVSSPNVKVHSHLQCRQMEPWMLHYLWQLINVLQVSRLLLLAGASPSYASDYLNGAPLTGVFASQGYHDMVSLLIEFGADVDAANAQGVTSLMFASKQGHLDVVRLLLSRGQR